MAEKSNKKSNQDILEELGVDLAPASKPTYSPREQRMIAGFEEIQRFVEEYDHAPAHGENNELFERLYATRLDRIRSNDECRNLAQALDSQGLLDNIAESPGEYKSDGYSDEALLAELGVDAPKEGDVTFLKHVKSRTQVRAAEEIAARTPCNDFEQFKPLFESVQQEIGQGVRLSGVIRKDAGFLKTDIKEGEFFILGGQTLYIAEVGDAIKAPNGQMDARLRVIYSNGTESNILLRSLQRAIYKDETSRKISGSTAGSLFSGESENEDLASGTIYVLRSKSDHPEIQKNRKIIHKLGVTGGSVKRRIAKAKRDPTYLMAEVEVVATYELFNINRTKLEHIIHRFFENVRFDIQINDRFGSPVTPREWFLVPLPIVDEVVEKIKDGTIGEYSYDRESAALVDISN